VNNGAFALLFTSKYSPPMWTNFSQGVGLELVYYSWTLLLVVHY